MSWLRYLLVFCCSLLPALAPAQEKTVLRPLSVGLMPYLATRTLLASYQPIALALERELKQPVQLNTAPDYDTFIKRVVDGEYDVVVLAPHYARLVTRDYGFIPLLVHKAPIRGVLITSRNKPLYSTEELRGETVAIAERSALLVIVGALTLSDEGMKEGSDYQFVETVSHSSALHNAISGKSRAALISYSTLTLAAPELQKDALIWRELNTIPGQFYVVHNRIPPERQKAIKTALLAFEKTPDGQQFFEKTKHGGYREPSREDGEFLDRLLPETRRQLSNVLPK
jgi:phosphonate transport system substrate-binding protein